MKNKSQRLTEQLCGRKSVPVRFCWSLNTTLLPKCSKEDHMFMTFLNTSWSLSNHAAPFTVTAGHAFGRKNHMDACGDDLNQFQMSHIMPKDTLRNRCIYFWFFFFAHVGTHSLPAESNLKTCIFSCVNPSDLHSSCFCLQLDVSFATSGTHAQTKGSVWFPRWVKFIIFWDRDTQAVSFIAVQHPSFHCWHLLHLLYLISFCSFLPICFLVPQCPYCTALINNRWCT